MSPWGDVLHYCEKCRHVGSLGKLCHGMGSCEHFCACGHYLRRAIDKKPGVDLTLSEEEVSDSRNIKFKVLSLEDMIVLCKIYILFMQC